MVDVIIPSMMAHKASKLLSEDGASNEIIKAGAKLGKGELDQSATAEDNTSAPRRASGDPLGFAQGGKTEAANATAEAMDDDIDFSQFLIPNEGASESKGEVSLSSGAEMSAPRRASGGEGNSLARSQDLAWSEATNSEAMPLRTGIRDLDERIKSGNLSMFDYYKARNFLGIDMNLMINGNLNLNQKIANTTKATQGIYDTIKALELGDNIIEKAQNNSGFWNGVSRKMNEVSGGLWSLNHDLAQTDNLATTYAYSVARALGNGKTNLEQQRDAKAMNAFKAKSAEENTSRMGQNQDINLTYLKNQIAELESLGGRVPSDVYEKLREYERKIAYINAKNGKIDINEYKSLGSASPSKSQEAKEEQIKRVRS